MKGKINVSMCCSFDYEKIKSVVLSQKKKLKRCCSSDYCSFGETIDYCSLDYCSFGECDSIYTQEW